MVNLALSRRCHLFLLSILACTAWNLSGNDGSSKATIERILSHDSESIGLILALCLIVATFLIPKILRLEPRFKIVGFEELFLVKISLNVLGHLFRLIYEFSSGNFALVLPLEYQN